MTASPGPSTTFPGPDPARSTMIGRDLERQLAGSLLHRDDVRLLTLTGPGGIGKTRLAMALAHHLQPSFAGGVTIVSLGAISNPDLVAPTIVRSLNVIETPGQPLDLAMASAIGDTHLLLVLDNLEHVLPAAGIVADLLARCPNLRILGTSRSLLHISGEQALPVPPLNLPDPDADTTLEAIAKSEAVQLFVARAQAVLPGFALTATNAVAIAAICRRLDGLPLAIELAAAQVGLLPPDALLSRIESGLPLPISGPRDAPARHRTIRNAIAWSYTLLPDAEQRLFRYLGVFVGGFGIEAAAALRAASSASEGDVLFELAALLDASLLRQEAIEGAPRFSMLETVRTFALELLAEHGDLETAHEAHTRWFLEFAGQTNLALVSPGGEHHMTRLEQERANLRATLDRLHAAGDHARLVEMVAALGGAWFEHNHAREGTAWLETALAIQDPAHPLDLARIRIELACLLNLHDQNGRAQALTESGLATLRAQGDAVTLAVALIWLGAVANNTGRHGNAEGYLVESLAIAAELEDAELAGVITARCLANLGAAAQETGDLDLAQSQHERALKLCREHGYLLGEVRSLRDLGDVARDRGDLAVALDWYRKSLDLLGSRRNLRVVAGSLVGAALAAVAWNQPILAAQLLGAADATQGVTGSLSGTSKDQEAHQRARAAVQMALDEKSFTDAWTIGHHYTMPQAVAAVHAVEPPAAVTAPREAGVASLSTRELDVLQRLVTGSSDRQIAEELYLSVRTVEAHVTHIRTKLGARTRTAAVSAAIAAGLIEPPT